MSCRHSGPHKGGFETWFGLQVEELIAKFAKKGATPSQIGVMLRDSHGVPQVNGITGSKVLRILKKSGEPVVCCDKRCCSLNSNAHELKKTMSPILQAVQSLLCIQQHESYLYTNVPVDQHAAHHHHHCKSIQHSTASVLQRSAKAFYLYPKCCTSVLAYHHIFLLQAWPLTFQRTCIT